MPRESGAHRETRGNASRLPSCGRESPDDAAFCSGSGARLAGPEHALLEERKIVTILFADLVGSTAQAENRDPEDVRATLSS